jgi:hypothetical protein
MILEEVYDWIAGGYYTGKAIVHEILCAGLWWPTLHRDTNEYSHTCDVFERV